jgi:tRNA pseudouridine32 synthase/23S rRNA pseudouridine746 synthase
LLDARVVYTPPPDLGLDLVYQDEALIVVNKPEGLLSVPGRGDDRADCMVSRVQLRVPEALTVHRLDMATSGLLVFARGPDMQRALSLGFQDRGVSKRYVAVVHGLVQPDEGVVDLPLIADWPNRPRQMVCHERGKPSQTRFQVLARDAVAAQTRVALEPITGRSHQLRVHMLALGHPIVGDPFYGDADVQRPFARLYLHAAELGMPHPVSGQWVSWACEAPF